MWNIYSIIYINILNIFLAHLLGQVSYCHHLASVVVVVRRKAIYNYHCSK
jgi:hypothetical protein